MNHLKDDRYVIAIKETLDSRNWRYLYTYGPTREENTFTAERKEAMVGDPRTMEILLRKVQQFHPKAETQFI
jgi:hypothetical protein